MVSFTALEERILAITIAVGQFRVVEEWQIELL